MTQRVLVYSPYGTWHFHGMYDITIAHGLKLRDAEVKYLCCDGCYSDCDVHWQATSPRDSNSCQTCSGLSKTLCDNMQMPFEWLSQYYPGDIEQQAAAWVNQLNDADLIAAQYQGFPLGQWVKSSVHSHYRINFLDLADSKISQAYRSYLASGYIALHAALNVFDQFRPDAVLMLNGRFFSHRIFFEVARSRGIRVLVHERGSRANALRFWENENCHSYDTFLRSWNAWKQVALQPNELDQIRQVLEEREFGKNTGWKSFAAPKSDPQSMLDKLGIARTDRIVSMYTSSDDEMAASEGWDTVMDQLDWIKRSINFFADRPEYTLIIRIHPNTAGINGTNEQFLLQLDELMASGVPQNVRIIPAEEKINSYQLMDISERCIVFSSTVSMEAAARGKPVLMTGGGWNFGHEFSVNLDQEQYYEQTLQSFLGMQPDSQHAEYAIRFAYHQFCRYSIPFPLVDVIDVFQAKNAYQSLEALLPGQDTALDKVCDFLLSGKPIYRSPENSKDHGDINHQPVNPQTSVSVIIPTYNRVDILEKCLDALAMQTYPFEQFEVIVCDDGSTDGTMRFLQSYSAPYRLKYHTQPNSGPARARNMGIRDAGNDLLLIMNDDAIADRHLLANHVQEHDRNKGQKIAVLGSFEFKPEYAQSAFGHLLAESDLLFYFGKMQAGGLYDYNHFYTCNISISRDAVIEAGLFDEDFKYPAAEDIELGYRLQQIGYAVLYAPQCKTVHDHEIGIAAFCRVHEVRGRGAAVLYQKYPELMPVRQGYAAYFPVWLKEQNLDENSVAQIVEKMQQIESRTASADDDIKNNAANAMLESARLLSHYFSMKGIVDEQARINIPAAPDSPDNVHKAKQVDISVIVTCYNYGQYIQDALKSVITQDFDNFEIIVVNDGSTDDSLEKMTAIIEQNPDVNITLVDQENSGQPAISRNNGIKASCGRYIICLDADDMFAQGLLSTCFSFLEQHPEFDIAYTDRLDFDGVDQVVHAEEFDPQAITDHNQISYCALYRRQVWENIGGYRTNVRGLEDWDFWVAAAANRFRAKRIPQALFMYRRHDTGLFMHAIENQQLRVAQIILNNQGMYEKDQIAAAQAILTEQARDQAAINSNHPLVSVVLPTYNRPDSLRHALESVAQQTYQNWEIIVVNDAGEDVRHVIEAFGLPEKIRYIRHQSNKGLPAARNTALRESKGEVICYLDDDDEYYINHLEVVVSALTKFPEMLVYTDAEYIYKKNDSDEKPSWVDQRYKELDYSRLTLLMTNFFPVNAVAHSRDLLELGGEFDETFTALEDWELWIRFSDHTDFRHIHETTVAVLHSTDQQCMTAHKREKLESLHERIYEMYPVDNQEVKNMRELVLSNLRAEQATPISEDDDPDKLYQDWIELHQLSHLDVEIMQDRIRQAGKGCEFNIIVNINENEADNVIPLISHLGNQIYQQWTLTIFSPLQQPDMIASFSGAVNWVQHDGKLDDAINASVAESAADWLLFMPADVLCEQQALLKTAVHSSANPVTKFIYTDHDVVCGEERADPYFKPGFNLDLLRGMNFIGELAFVERQTFLEAGGFVDYGEQSIYDLAFRIAEHYGEQSIGHIEDILYHVSGDTVADENIQMGIIQSHLQRSGIPSNVKHSLVEGTYNIEYHYDDNPLVSIIVTTRNKFEYLKPCLDSLLARTTYANYEVLVVDNDSDDPELIEYLNALAQDSRVRVLSAPGEFSYARLCNLARPNARGDYLIFLHNDTEIVQDQWVDRLLNYARRADVGIVGSRLLTPGSGKVQNTGLIMGKYSLLGGMHADKLGLREGGYHNIAHVGHEVTVVSGACQMIAGNIYDALNGMDEETFPVFFGDVDLCLRAREQGYKVIWTPFSSLLHHGGVSIKPSSRDIRQQARYLISRDQETHRFYKSYLHLMGNDPFYNTNLSLVSDDVVVEHQVLRNWDNQYLGMPKVYGIPLSGGSGEYRLRAPFRMLERNRVCLCDTSSTRKINQQRFPSLTEMARLAPDTVVFHAPIADEPLNALKQYRQYTDIDIVFTMDDLLTNLPEDNPFRKIAPRDAHSRLREALSYSDRLIVTTEPLRQLCEKMIDDIHVIPNYLEDELWSGLVSQRSRGRKPRVGWAGAQQHKGDLQFILEIVAETAQQVDWVFFGMCPDEIKPYVAEEHEFEKSFTDYAAKLASLDLDIAIAPLENHPFNEAKSNLRLLEYGIMGWPVICTDIYPYQNAPVKRVRNNKQEWMQAILERIHDLDAAYSEGDLLRQWVIDNYMLNDHVDQWRRAVLSSVAEISQHNIRSAGEV